LRENLKENLDGEDARSSRTSSKESSSRWFERWGKETPSGIWSYADVDEMTEELEKEFLATRPQR
jgi:hypothetical protein